MARTRILLDSNSYFRLANSIHPLLDTEFGDKNYCLYVLKDLEKEYDRSPRLQTKFHWVNEDKYFENRKRKLTVSRKDKKAIDRTVEFLEEHKYNNCLGVSSVDIKNLAHGHVLDIPVVTDDKDMIELAKAFAIETMSSLKLLTLMVKSGHISKKKVRDIITYWKYNKDTPGNYRKEYKKLFKGNAP